MLNVRLFFIELIYYVLFYFKQDSLTILRDLSLLQIQMRDLDGYKVRIKRSIYYIII
jgi:hypothetical protein